MSTRPTNIQRTVANEIAEQKKRFGISWNDMSITQRMNSVASRLFFIVAQQDAVTGISGDCIPSGYICELHTALVNAFHDRTAS